MSMRWSVEHSVVPNRFTRLVSLGAAAAFGIACSSDRTVTLTGVTTEASSVAAAPSAGGAPIKDRYIVVFRDAVANPAAEADALMRGRGGEVHFRYDRALKGFAATIPAQALEQIRRNPSVLFIEQDMTMEASVTQSGATWGIDRIDQRTLPLSGTFTYSQTASGVFAYIVDTGIRSTHTEFSTRVLAGRNFVSGKNTTEDCNGHGTHVAGTVGGTKYGVAKGVRLIPVRVLGCNGSGTNSGVIAGVDYVAKDVGRRPAVANMSLGGGISTALDAAVSNAIAAGVTFVVAAGNSNADACLSSPARVPSAITVGATSDVDARASFSNWGNCLDIFAPGVNITSAWSSGNTAVSTISGTSMAAPHVAGVAALILSASPNASPSTIATTIANSASGLTGDFKTTNPKLLFTNY